ncbi:putative C6 transcription factor, partial [Ilyonectria destructans]
MEDGQLSRLACDRCYRRKARCDKVLPSCSSCLRSGASCCYNARSALVRRDDFEAVERRLRQMEAKNQALSKQLRDARSAQPPSSPRSPAEQPTNGAPEARAASSTAHDDGQESDARNQNEVAKQVFSLSLNAGAQKQYLGSASGAILANLLGLRNSPAHTGEDIDDEPLFRRFTAAGGGQRHGTPEPVKEMILPEQLARGLLGAYLSHDHICYPYLLPKNLVNSVMAMYSEHGYYESHHVEAFTMDMIYAIATAQVHKFSWQVMPDAETHYERAISKFGRVLEIGGLVALQSIMLLCQYRMLSVSYGTSASLWHLLGMAARLGLELGLHREDVYSIPAGLSPSALEDVKVGLELKRRCFWSLFGMDRVVSNTLGRPMAINLEDIDTEYPSLEETSDPISNASPSVDDILQYPQWPRNTAIFVHITWHRVITGKILASLHNMPKSKIPNLETCMDIRQKLADELDQWKAGVSSLPLPNTSRLRSQENTSTFKSPEWYSLLYHNSMLMIYRPTHTSQDISQTTK